MFIVDGKYRLKSMNSCVSFLIFFVFTTGVLAYTTALEVTQCIVENKDYWSSLFRPSDFFQKYKYVRYCFVLPKNTRKMLKIWQSLLACLNYSKSVVSLVSGAYFLYVETQICFRWC